MYIRRIIRSINIYNMDFGLTPKQQIHNEKVRANLEQHRMKLLAMTKSLPKDCDHLPPKNNKINIKN